MTSQDIDPLIKQLQSADVQERQQAAIELSGIMNDRLVEPLLDALNDSDSSVRANAAYGLGVNKAPVAVEPLITLLRDSDDIVRGRAAIALAQIGDIRAIDPLIDALDDSGPQTKNSIIFALVASRAVQAVEPLIVLLDSDEPPTQGAAAWALGTIGDSRAVDPLLDLLDVSDGSLHGVIATALGEIADVRALNSLCSLLNSSDDNVRGNAAYALGELGQEHTIPQLIGLLNDSSAEVRAKTAQALGKLGTLTDNTSMVEPLCTLLEDYVQLAHGSGPNFVCEYAANALSWIGTDEALAAVEAWKRTAQQKLLPHRINDLIRILQIQDPQTREHFLSELQTIGSPAVPPLIVALGTHQIVRVRQGAARALGMIGDKRAIKPLIKALNDPDSGVWSQATAALGKMGSQAEKPLRKVLHNKREPVRLGSALALWRIKREEKAFTTVLQALQHDDVVIRGSAITSLWMQPDERAVASLQIQLQKEEVGGMMAKYILHALEIIGGSLATVTVANYMAENREKL